MGKPFCAEKQSAAPQATGSRPAACEAALFVSSQKQLFLVLFFYNTIYVYQFFCKIFEHHSCHQMILTVDHQK